MPYGTLEHRCHLFLGSAWLDEQLPGYTMSKIESLLDNVLDLKTANGTNMPYEGWVEVEFNLETSSEDRTVIVPMLVTEEILEYPIIGYNVIEELVKVNEAPEDMAKEWAASFPDIHFAKVQSLVSFIQAPSPEQLCLIKTTKHDMVIPSRTTVTVKCRANTGPVAERIPVLFEPSIEPSWPSGLEISEELLTIPHGSTCRVQIKVSNTSNHDITLRKRTALGTLQLVRSVTPQEVHKKNADLFESQTVHTIYSTEEKNASVPVSQDEMHTPDKEKVTAKIL